MMHPQFRADLLHERSHQLELDVRRTFLLTSRTQPAPINDENVSLRLCSVHDDAALERLAVLEGRPSPRGRFVLAEVNGAVVAALPLSGGEPLADPFRPTAHLLPLLRLRAAQLDGHPRARIDAAKAIAARVLHAAR
jgi:hypothetical protein